MNTTIKTICCTGFKGYLSKLPQIEKFLNQHIQYFPVTFTLALNEAVSNAISYGYGGYHNAKAKIVLKRRGHKLYARVVSDNNGFNVLDQITKVNNKLENNEWDLDDTRGRGLPLMATFSSHVRFNNSGNQVLLVLNLQDKPDDIGCKLKFIDVHTQTSCNEENQAYG